MTGRTVKPVKPLAENVPDFSTFVHVVSVTNFLLVAVVRLFPALSTSQLVASMPVNLTFVGDMTYSTYNMKRR